MQLTEHFSLEECIHSGAAERMGIDNSPDEAMRAFDSAWTANITEP